MGALSDLGASLPCYQGDYLAAAVQIARSDESFRAAGPLDCLLDGLTATYFEPVLLLG